MGRNHNRMKRPESLQWYFNSFLNCISKNLFKDKASLVLDGANILNSRNFKTRTIGRNYVLNQANSPNAERYRLSFVYKFNNKEGQTVRQAKSGNRN